MVSRFVVLACAAMLLLAGCSSGPVTSTTAGTAVDGGTDGTSVTATTTNGVGTTTGGPDTSEFDALDTVPALAVDGVNASALLAAHAASLDGSSYRVDATLNASGLYALDQATTVRAGANDRRVYVVRTRTDRTDATTRAFANDTRVVVERTNATATVYSAYRVGADGTRFDVAGQVREYVRLGDYAVRRTFTVDGEPRIEYVATGAADVADADGVEAYRGRLVVSPDGRIHAFSANLTESSGYGTVNTTFSFALGDVGGVDASTPSWVATARDRALTVDFAYEYDDGVVTITHDGGDVVPAGTRVAVTERDGRGTFTVVLPRAFEPGDELAVAPGDDAALALAFGTKPSTDGGFDGRVRVELSTLDGETVVRRTLDEAVNATASASATATAGGGRAASIPRSDRWKQN